MIRVGIWIGLGFGWERFGLGRAWVGGWDQGFEQLLGMDHWFWEGLGFQATGIGIGYGSCVG